MLSRCLSNAALLLCALAASITPTPATGHPAFEPPANHLWQRAYQWPAAPPAADHPGLARPLHLDAAHLGDEQLLFRVPFAEVPDWRSSTLILYLDLDNRPDTGRMEGPHRGTDVMAVIHGGQASLSFHHPDFSSANTRFRARQEGSTLLLRLQAPLPEGQAALSLRLRLVTQRANTPGQTMPLQRVTLPRHPGPAPAMPDAHVTWLGEPPTYRFQGQGVALEARENRGLRADQVRPADPMVFGRARPAIPLKSQPRRQQSGDLALEGVPVHFLEEAGIDRPQAAYRFGFPLPRGGVFDLAHLRLDDETGASLPAQFTATAFWPDDSLQWVLVEGTLALGAHQQRTLHLTAGHSLPPQVIASPLRVDLQDGQWRVATGPMEVRIDPRHFRLLDEVHLLSSDTGARHRHLTAPHGVVLTDDQGRTFSTAAAPPTEATIEQAGPETVVLRVEGAYGDDQGHTLHRYLTRLTFRARSSRIEIAHTHLNDHLEHEFSDLRSLSLPLQHHSARGTAENRLLAPGTAEAPPQWVIGEPLRVFQSDERTSHWQQAGHAPTARGAASGLFERTEGASRLTGIVHAFWQRWPKAIAFSDGALHLDLLPALPDADYGKALPVHLRYPFVDGFHRLKWGMSFTERITLDLDPATDPRALAAEAEVPLIAVIPSDWYVRTEALAPTAAYRPGQFELWDDFVAEGYRHHRQDQRASRAFGYLNHGDWFGERGRNWGNNEYDLAQNFFLQFIRTGRRDYQRLALAAARHQADVDIVHAYPDPAYLGANHQHSIGHTGQWSHRPKEATWSYAYDGHTSADNGHTWADGMVLAWQLTGDARVMEAALALGEHITEAMAPNFRDLGTHERSAGWSLRAILALHRATGDPHYLQAAKHLAEVSLRAQDRTGSGAWPHQLPADHASGRLDARGNNVFLVGILLSGLQAYHQVTADPQVAEAIVAGARWIARSWDARVGGWPYAALADGSVFQPAMIQLNTQIVGPVAYAAMLADDAELMGIAREALTAALVFDRGTVLGKDLSIRMYFVPETLAQLQRWFDQRDPAAAGSLMNREAANRALETTALSERFSSRAPDQKIFHLILQAPTAQLTATRQPHGSLPVRQANPQLTLRRAGETSGKTATVRALPLQGGHTESFEVTGQPGDSLIVSIDDDQRFVWDLQATGAVVAAQIGPDFRFGGVGRSRYAFFVPEETERFTVRIQGIHPGAYGAAVLDPDGRVVQILQGVHRGAARMPLATGEDETSDPGFREGRISPAPATRGRSWQLVLWATGDLGVDLQGVPPFLTLGADAASFRAATPVAEQP